MTYAEAKDQVAREDGHAKGWEHLVQYCIIMGEDMSPYYERAGKILEEAAALAIASAREEARNGYFRDGYALGYECGNTDGACGTSHANKVPTDKEIDDYLQEPLTAQA